MSNLQAYELFYHKDLNTIGVNTLAPRTTWMPYQDEQSALTMDRDKSKYYQPLIGTWKFNYYDHPGQVPAGIEQVNYNDEGWKDVSVPSCWQLDGWDKPVYANVKYPYPVDEPNIPSQNPVGCYRMNFDLNKSFEGRRTVLHFGGVCAAFYVYVNGKFIGYSEGSHMPSEFDVTDYLVEVGNQLTVIVFKWSTASYIEDQDFWRLNGIIREVYLYSTHRVYTKDVWVKGGLSEDLNDGEFRLEMDLEDSNLQLKAEVAESNVKLSYQIDLYKTGVYMDKQAPVKVESFNGEIINGKAAMSSLVANVLKWSGDLPNLYVAVVKILADEKIVEVSSYEFGFRDVRIKDGKLWINGQSIVLKGVNRHDTHPTKGYAVSRQDIDEDITLMLKHNINMVRTSHYPNDPYLYQLCNRYGMYVMDEADLEMHGFILLNKLKFNGKEQRMTLNNDPRWEHMFIDRALKMVERDKNHPSIISWSLGNESASGENHRIMANWVRNRDDSRFIHYESAGEERYVDVVSYMYPSVDQVHEEALRTDETRPFFVCEFMHAMGNSMGNAREYWDIMFEDNRLIGGCIWEWADHGLLTETEDGRPYYAYGGDFGDEPHDFKFCIDGMVFPDRVPHTGLTELKEVIAPVRFKDFDAKRKKVTVINRYDFIGLDHLELTCELMVDGEVKVRGKIDFPNVEPKGQVEISFEKQINQVVSDYKECEVFLNLYVDYKNPILWQVEEPRVCSSQFLVEAGKGLNKLEDSKGLNKIDDGLNELLGDSEHNNEKAKKDLTVKDKGPIITVSGDDFDIRFDKVLGTMTDYTYKGSKLLVGGIHENFFRAATDNDERGWVQRTDCVAGDWRQAGLDMLWRNVTETGYEVSDHGFKFMVTTRHGKPTMKIAYITKVTYWVQDNGRVKVDINFMPQQSIDSVPRLGMTFNMPEGYEEVKWYGRGPHENYVDRKESALVGLYEAKVDDLFIDYIIPQENGNHTDTRWVKIVNNKGLGLMVKSSSTFDFGVSHYTVANLYKAMHPYDLKPLKETVVNIDYGQTGIGNGSCGPLTWVMDQYKIPAIKTDFDFELMPIGD